MRMARAIALHVLLATLISFQWPVVVQAAELLTSLDRVNSGSVLTCDYEFLSGAYLFTCEDAFGEFSVQCVADAEPPRLAAAVRGERVDVICSVTREISVQGNALRLGCFKFDSKHVENNQSMARQYPELLRGRKLRVAQCTSEKVDFVPDAKAVVAADRHG